MKSARQHLIQNENATCPSDVRPSPPDRNGTDPTPRFPVSFALELIIFPNQIQEIPQYL